MKSPYSVESWEPIVIPQAASAGLSIPFVMKWIEVESGGNPCAFGTRERGADGNPKEIGLVQIFNPDDFANLGIDANKLRTYCVDGTQTCSRLLTADEMFYAVATAIKLIQSCRTRALAKLSSIGARWPLRDTYKLTKLVHALPGLVNGLATVAKHLGRAPESWQEFRDVATSGDVRFDGNEKHGTEHYRGQFAKLFHNAEETGNTVPESVT